MSHTPSDRANDTVLRRVHRTIEGENGALFSACERYRYRLWRTWGSGKLVNFVMLNPSTADERTNDPTIERCVKRAGQWGYDGLIVTNLFAWRATDPSELRKVSEPVGWPTNDHALEVAAVEAELIVCAWGTDGIYLNRAAKVVTILRMFAAEKLRALKFSKSGEPYHPLYLPYSLQPVAFPAAARSALADGGRT